MSGFLSGIGGAFLSGGFFGPSGGGGTSEAVTALSPHRSLDLGGFDRRGCSASLSIASAPTITVARYFSDIADFVTFYLFRKHDLFGHLQTTRALPASSLAGVVLEFDAVLTGLQSPTSFKFQSEILPCVLTKLSYALL